MIYDIDAAIDNWARWCLRTGDCYPEGYPPEWPMGAHAKPYKVMVTEEEMLEQMEREREPEAPWAERVEVWVQQLEPWHKIAIQTNFIEFHESKRAGMKLTSEEFLWRKAKWYANATGTAHNIDEYQRAVGSAVAELREALTAYMRGV